jgi:D-alanine-D-alanine ligase
MSQKKLTIAYTCNIRPKELDGNERYGEWESQETIDTVIESFEKTGNRVLLFDAGEDIYHRLLRHSREIDIVFNNAEGFQEAQLREARVPFFCEEASLHYSGSGPQTLIDAMDKATTKEILKNYGITTPLFQKMDNYTDKLQKHLRFPLMVKPSSEGTSIGISQKSRVHTNKQLNSAVRKIIREYNQPALIEEFIPGVEYTVGIIGNLIFPILKVPFDDIPGKPIIRDPHTKDIETPHMRLMPFEEEGYLNLAKQTAIAFDALACDDYCRMDFRKGKDGRFYFLEMNPLPGIHPKEADLTHMVQHAGLKHDEMINMILYEAIKRGRKDKRYSEIFEDGKIEGIKDYVQKARARLEFYDKELGEGNYRLVKIKSIER